MLRDNLVGLIEPMRISAGVDPLALSIQKQASDDRSSCLENPRPEGAESSLTETSPLHFRLSQHRYIQTRSFSGGLAAVRTDNELWDYVDKDGKERIPPQFTLAWDFYEKAAAVYRGDRCGFIDEAGLEVVPFQFSECRGMKDGVGAVRVDKQWGYITIAGDFFITPSFEDAELFFEGLAAVEKNGKWGFIDREGRVVISPQFDYSRAEPTITQFSEGLAGVTKNGKFGYVDKTGAYVIGPIFTKGFEFRDGI